ncbi:MAG: hypothetical protein ACNI26_04715 [Terasakiella sp.]|uniref:hypothetical protein n=1 Tax=unclassified Terasakiella TaxID=2614952 RepID=UPI003AFFF343
MNADHNGIENIGDDDDTCLIATTLYNAQGFENALARVSDYIREAEDTMQRREWQRIALELTNLCAADPQCEAKKRKSLN